MNEFLPPPPKLIKRKRAPVPPTVISPVTASITSGMIGPTPIKRKRTAAEIENQQHLATKGPGVGGGDNDKECSTTTTTTVAKKKRRVPSAKRRTGVNGDDQGSKCDIDPHLLSKLTYGTTRKQRHWVLKEMLTGVNRLWAVAGQELSEDHARVILDYVTRVEQRLYDGVFGKPLDPCFNLYRANLYKKLAFEVIYALRSNGIVLMQKYEPELLASLPAHLLSEGTKQGKVYREWKEHQENVRAYEEELLRAKRETKGEGWLRCPRCSGKFEVSELQMRGGDEPATIFRTCQNCGFTKRNG